MKMSEKALVDLEEVIDASTEPEITPEAKQLIKKKILKEKEKQRQKSPLATDKWIYRFVVCFLGLAILSCLYFTFDLVSGASDQTTVKIPEIFLAIGSAAVGALAGLLAPSPGSGSDE